MNISRQNDKIKLIKAKYFSKIKSIFDKSLGKDGDVYNKIDDIQKCIKDCDSEIYQLKLDDNKKNQIHIQTFENFNK